MPSVAQPTVVGGMSASTFFSLASKSFNFLLICVADGRTYCNAGTDTKRLPGLESPSGHICHPPPDMSDLALDLL